MSKSAQPPESDDSVPESDESVRGSEFGARQPDYRLGEAGDLVIHAGPRQSPRILSVPTRHTAHVIELADGDDLFASVVGLLESLEVPGLMVEFVAGEFGRINYVYPAYGPDAEHPMSFTSEFHREDPATLNHASATVGSRDGAAFCHIHASWITEEGVTRGGHLLPGTRVGPTGMRLRVFALTDATLLSETDPETGFSAFAPVSAPTGPPTEEPADAVISRVRPGELIDEAITSVCREAGFDSAEVRASLGSTTGAVFTDATAPWPAVEFTHLTGSIKGALGEDPRVRFEAEVVDVAGDVHAGVLAARANPVAVTFELFVLQA